nr:hypothetical protein [Tanacetum cinerariifolium]
MMSEDSSAAGTNNRPPMLEESDYKSWMIRIERYIKGKTHGKLIWKSILNRPSAHPQIIDPVPTGSPAGIVMQPRDKRDEEFTDAENLKELCDIQASNIISQGLPRRIFNTLNQTQSAKEIWESLELLMKGSGQTLDRRKEDLFDEYKRFHANGNELIQDYFVRFYKLINDMKVTKLMIPTHQMNTKFVNNLPSYWSKYVTSVKNVKNLSTDSYIDLYTHLRPYEEHALKKLKKQEQSSSVVDPLAYLVKTTHQQEPTHSTTTSPSQLTPALASTSSFTAQSHDDAMLATMKQIANLLSGFQKQFPPTNNQLRSSSNTRTHATNNRQGVNNKKKVICYNCRGEGHVARQCREPKRPKDSLWHQDKSMLLQAKENGAILDVEAKAFLADVECNVPLAEPLALTTTNISSQINEVRTFNDNIFETVSPSWPSKVPHDEHLKSNDDSVHEDYTIPYNQYLATKESQDVPTEASPIPPTVAYMLQTLTDLTIQVEGHRKVIVARNKRNSKLEQETELLKTTLRNKEATIASLTSETETVLSEKKTLEDKYLEEIVCLKNDNQVANGLLQKFQMPTQTIPMLSKRPVTASNDIHKIGLGLCNSWFGRKAQLSQPTLYDGHRLLQPGHAPVMISDSHETLLETEELSREQVYWLSASDIASQSSDPPKHVISFVHTRPVNSEEFERIFDELDSDYEQTVLANKNLLIEKKNLLIKNKSLISDSISKDICFIVLASVNIVPPISDCMCAKLRTSCDREHNRVLELEAEISKLHNMLKESEKRCVFIQKDHIDLQVKFQNFKECANSNATPSNAILEINKLKDQLQERDETIRNLESQFNILRMLKIGSPVGSLDKNALETEITQLKDNITSLRIQNDGYKIKIANHTRRYLELSKASTHSRNTSNVKIAALNTEIAKMKPSGSGTKVSGPKTPEKPKVLAPWMYAISSKRGDWAPPTPRNKHVTFQEPLRVSTTHTKQPDVNNHKQPNVNVIVSTGLTPAAEVSKPQFMRENQKSRVLPTKNESARRVEDHPRNLNKTNNVNSSLNDKRFGSANNTVCDACNKCLVSFTHDNCYVCSVNTMHAKKPQVARPKTIPKNVRKRDITVAYRIVPQWKPIG